MSPNTTKNTLKNSTISSVGGVSFNTLEITSELYSENLQLSKNGKVGLNLQKRAHSKALNSLLFGKMLCNLDSNLKAQYQDTYYCSHNIFIQRKKAKSNFCKKRWCMICNRIRTAQLISTYTPTLESWENKQFITLTVKNMKRESLPEAIEKMYKDFAKIKDLERKQNSKIVGLRKLEITYNKHEDEYHPHYHLIIEDPSKSKRIINRWLELNPTASQKGQDARKANNSSCFELFKYFTKLTSNSSKDKSISIHALDTIFNAIQGIRTFQPFGFLAHKMEAPPENLDMTETTKEEIEHYNYEYKTRDWYNAETGELLTNYKAGNHLKNFDEKITNKELFDSENSAETKKVSKEKEAQNVIKYTENLITAFENECTNEI